MNLRSSQTHLPEQMKLKLVDHSGSQAWSRIAAAGKKKRDEPLNQYAVPRPLQIIDNFLLAPFDVIANWIFTLHWVNSIG